jgi:hypothetical protein
MGTWYSKKRIGETMINHIARSKGLDPSTIVDHVVRIDAAYLAIRTECGAVVGAVVVITHDRSRGEIGLKWVEESMGPYYYDIPDRILDKLTPTTYQHALNWREKCRAYNARKRALKGDLTGKRVRIGCGIYRIERRNNYRRGAWIGIYEGTGMQYTIRRSALNRAEVVD